MHPSRLPRLPREIKLFGIHASNPSVPICSRLFVSSSLSLSCGPLVNSEHQRQQEEMASRRVAEGEESRVLTESFALTIGEEAESGSEDTSDEGAKPPVQAIPGPTAETQCGEEESKEQEQQGAADNEQDQPSNTGRSAGGAMSNLRENLSSFECAPRTVRAYTLCTSTHRLRFLAPTSQQALNKSRLLYLPTLLVRHENGRRAMRRRSPSPVPDYTRR